MNFEMDGEGNDGHIDGISLEGAPMRSLACLTDKVKPILSTSRLSTAGSRRRSGLIAIILEINICLKVTEYRENIERIDSVIRTRSSDRRGITSD